MRKLRHYRRILEIPRVSPYLTLFAHVRVAGWRERIKAAGTLFGKLLSSLFLPQHISEFSVRIYHGSVASVFSTVTAKNACPNSVG